jgi:hypothetical protein
MSKNYEITDSFAIKVPPNVFIRSESGSGGSLIITYRARFFDAESCEEGLLKAKRMLFDAVTTFVERED